MRESLANFFNGAGYVFHGICQFYRMPRLWKYALFPFFITFGICAGFCYLLFGLLLPQIHQTVTQWIPPDHWYSFLRNVLTGGFYLTFGLGAVLLIALAAGSLFEITGSLFLARMVRKFETAYYGRPDPGIPFRKDLENTLKSILFSCNTLLLYLFLFTAGLFLPGFMQIFSVFLLGYRYAVSYGSEAGFNHGLSIPMQKASFRGKKMFLFGFGTLVFLFLLIPLLSIPLIPGFVLGGTMLGDERRNGAEDHPPKNV